MAQPSVAECIARGLLRPVFQPIASLRSGDVLGYEALLRGPAGTALESAPALFAQARREECAVQLEHAAADAALLAFWETGLPGKLFLNFSAGAMVDMVQRVAGDRHGRGVLANARLDVTRIVIELTEQFVEDPGSALDDAVRALRMAGAAFALDDYGSGNANLGQWIRFRPDYLKIDRSIVAGIAESGFRFDAVRQLQGLAAASNTILIAEGIESLADLAVCRDIGIAFAQGYCLGRPAETPASRITGSALEALQSGAGEVLRGK